jgi:hypothetical protein
MQKNDTRIRSLTHLSKGETFYGALFTVRGIKLEEETFYVTHVFDMLLCIVQICVKVS